MPNTTRHGVAAMLMSLECDVRAGVRGTHWSVRFTLECVVHAGVRGSHWGVWLHMLAYECSSSRPWPFSLGRARNIPHYVWIPLSFPRPERLEVGMFLARGMRTPHPGRPPGYLGACCVHTPGAMRTRPNFARNGDFGPKSNN